MLKMENMLTISSDHISDATAEKLAADPDDNCLGLSVYPKSEYGWFITDIKNIDTSKAYSKEGPIPDDLATVINFAKEVGADILCLDCDGPELSFLPSFDNDEKDNIISEIGTAEETLSYIKRLLDAHQDFSRKNPEINYELVVAINRILKGECNSQVDL